MKSRRDDKILALMRNRSLILKGWHDSCGTHDTPSEFLRGHSSFDRVLGYGLKHEDAFQNTHLGRIGR